jgi:Ni,Fe-hydrogenase maturation factor
VLLQVFKKREASWKDCKEGQKAETLTPLMKEQTPVLIVDALKYGDFLRMPKRIIKAEEKTFKVAFPGCDVKDLPAFRK